MSNCSWNRCARSCSAASRSIRQRKKSAAAVSSSSGTYFPLFADRDAAKAASYSRKIPVVSYFSGSVRGLGPGSEVTMHGLVVGHVTDVRLAYDAAKDTIVAPVRFEVEPERILGVGAKSIFKTPAEAMAAVVKQGMRAHVAERQPDHRAAVGRAGFRAEAPPAR